MISISDELCDAIEVPRGSQMRMTPHNVLEFTVISIPDEICDFLKIHYGAQMSFSEIERQCKKYLKDRFLPITLDRLTCNKDDEMRKLFALRALIRPETYPIPAELSNFLQVAKGVQMNRHDVEYHVRLYLDENKLYNPRTGMVLNTDENLRTIFSLPEGVEQVSYNQLMTNIIGYFVRKVQYPNTNLGHTKRAQVTISDDLCDFLKVPHGTRQSMMDVMLEVALYTEREGLTVWDTVKNSFTLDANLCVLFSVTPDAIVRYDEMDKYLQKHFESI